MNIFKVTNLCTCYKANMEICSLSYNSKGERANGLTGQNRWSKDYITKNLLLNFTFKNHGQSRYIAANNRSTKDICSPPKVWRFCCVVKFCSPWNFITLLKSNKVSYFGGSAFFWSNNPLDTYLALHVAGDRLGTHDSIINTVPSLTITMLLAWSSWKFWSCCNYFSFSLAGNSRFILKQTGHRHHHTQDTSSKNYEMKNKNVNHVVINLKTEDTTFDYNISSNEFNDWKLHL